MRFMRHADGCARRSSDRTDGRRARIYGRSVIDGRARQVRSGRIHYRWSDAPNSGPLPHACTANSLARINSRYKRGFETKLPPLLGNSFNPVVYAPTFAAVGWPGG